MNHPELFLTDQPAEMDETVIKNGLGNYNELQTGYRDSRPLAALLRDPESAETLGGMIGRTSYGLLFIDQVFLPPAARGQDIGTRLLRMMEQEGARRGCRSGFLFTITHQAPGFYQRNGWTEFGRIACDPPGTARVFMTKTLNHDADA